MKIVSLPPVITPPPPTNDDTTPLAQIEHALAPLHPALQRWLRGPLVNKQNDPAITSALALLEHAGSYNKGSHAVVAALMGAGCLNDDAWQDKAALDDTTIDPVSVLAKRQVPGAADDEQKVIELAAALQPLTQTHEWIEKSQLTSRRGVLGEVLRTHAIHASEPNVQTERGLLVLDRPAVLAAAKTVLEAKAICAANGLDAAKIYRYFGSDGKPAFALLLSEIDVLVSIGSKPIRLENVKAGVGTSGTARKQNQTAKEVFASPTGVIVRFQNGRSEDVSHTFDRSPQALAALELRTVGPLEDPAYDVGLLLSAHDIGILAERMGS